MLAYYSNESGESHVYVRPYDAADGSLGPPRRVTTEAGTSILFWSLDGSRLHYIDKNDHLMAIEVRGDGDVTVSDEEDILDVGDLRAVGKEIASLPGGSRFVFIQKGDQEKEAEHLNVVLNWLGAGE
jgi:hypothetical protein